MPELGLDFETYADVDLTVEGLDNYISHPSFRVIMAAVHDGVASNIYNFVTAKYYNHYDEALENFKHAIGSATILWAHNRTFETRVLEAMGIYHEDIRDSAVISRAVGAHSRLEFAGPQLINTPKDFEGTRLIKLFSMPRGNGIPLIDEIDSWSAETWEDMWLFEQYCMTDAELSRQIAHDYHLHFPEKEWAYERLSYEINQAGWYVDMPLLDRMQQVQQSNLDHLLRMFYHSHGEVNFNSPQQLTAYCRERGVRITSWTRESVEKYLGLVTQEWDKRHGAKRDTYTDEQRTKINNVLHLLLTKQALGGSALSKLPKIRELTNRRDGRLRDQYVHIGAGQTFRTSGRAAQMQNLTRLGSAVADMENRDVLMNMTNDDLADNLRQVFRAQHPEGEIIVADFSAIESRGLAYLAGAQWKLDAYRQGRDMYKMQWVQMAAARGEHIRYEDVDSEGRRGGKLGELACGYQAGVKGVSVFAEKMGLDLTLDEVSTTVTSWRDSNSEIVDLWGKLDDALWRAVERGTSSFTAGTNEQLLIGFDATEDPVSLQTQAAKEGLTTKTIMMTVMVRDSDFPGWDTLLRRFFPGVFIEGRQICYHKPSGKQAGSPWKNTWREKNETGRYTLYGGKLAGILTQSFCREIFFDRLTYLRSQLEPFSAVAKIIGQLHDEVNVEFTPDRAKAPSENAETLRDVKSVIEHSMSFLPQLPDFPLAVEVASALRYIK